MNQRGDFASMMESTQAAGENRVAKRLRTGAVVEGTVVQIGKDSVFVDVGTTAEGRIERGELEDKAGELHIKVGDKLTAMVARMTDNGPLLVLSLGRGGKSQLDVASLENAKQNGIPVDGTVQKAVKGGLEVLVGGVRAFCPASQIDVTFIKDLQPFEGQTLSFKVTEVRDGGRSVVLSRRALLEQARSQLSQEVVSRLHVGSDYEGTVQSLQKYGAFIDLGGGVEGLVHISELAHGRVDRVEDVLQVGEKIMVRVLAIDPQDKGPHPKLRLSVRALEQAPARAEAPQAGEIFSGTVSRLGDNGVFVDTEKGTGLVPTRELGIPRGADFRRMFPIGKAVQVVTINRDGGNGKLTFSIARVAGVEEEQNYTAFARSQGERPASAARDIGSFGELLRQKLGMPVPAAAPAAPAPPAPAAPAPAASAAAAPVSAPFAQPFPAPSAPSARRNPSGHVGQDGTIRGRR